SFAPSAAALIATSRATASIVLMGHLLRAVRIAKVPRGDKNRGRLTRRVRPSRIRRPFLVSRTRDTSVPNPKSVTKFRGASTTLAALLLLGIAPTIPRRRALPAPPIHPRLWQRPSGPGP